VHLELSSGASVTTDSRPGSDPRAGFVVSKGVGNSVVRHAVARKLRHLVRPRLALLPHGAHLVVRALPGAGAATSTQLGADLDAALQRALRKAQGPVPTSAGAGVAT
jgi:ribonuclease P protein component